MNSANSTQLPLIEAPPIAVAATLEHILISPGHNYYRKRGDDGSIIHDTLDVVEVNCVEGRGLEGDRYFDKKPGAAGQVTFIDAAVIDAVRERFGVPGLSPKIFRRNLIVRGMDLRHLYKQRFTFQGVTFEGAQECKPCVWMDRMIADGAQLFLRSPFFGGLRARVLTSGVLRVDTRATKPLADSLDARQ